MSFYLHYLLYIYIYIYIYIYLYRIFPWTTDFMIIMYNESYICLYVYLIYIENNKMSNACYIRPISIVRQYFFII